MGYVRGYTIANDVTVRDFVHNFFRPPVKAKGFDTFTPLGPWMIDRDDLPDPGNVALRTLVNGELRQEGDLAQQIWKVPETIAYLSTLVELRPGDLVMTGTPKGVGPVVPGDVLEGHIDGVGDLRVEYGS
jgi:5-oxopent-3-ene-1,2,5-tricarboxylate decarboxylase/2-hydroxyhepta-2,4-diene-1,7-dioate isomerase